MPPKKVPIFIFCRQNYHPSKCLKKIGIPYNMTMYCWGATSWNQLVWSILPLVKVHRAKTTKTHIYWLKECMTFLTTVHVFINNFVSNTTSYFVLKSTTHKKRCPLITAPKPQKPLGPGNLPCCGACCTCDTLGISVPPIEASRNVSEKIGSNHTKMQRHYISECSIVQ